MSTPYRVPILDMFDWQEAVAGRVASPPAANRGDRYIIIPTASGAWAGHNNDITYYDGSNWIFVTPTTGWVGYVTNESSYYYWNGSIWRKLLHKTSADIDEMFVEVMG